MLRRPCLDCPRLSMPGRPRCERHEKAKMRQRNAAHVARRRARPGDGAAARLRRHLNAQGFGTCYLCHYSFPASLLQVDHVLALANGGTDTDDNVAPACLACHDAKTRSERATR